VRAATPALFLLKLLNAKKLIFGGSILLNAVIGSALAWSLAHRPTPAAASAPALAVEPAVSLPDIAAERVTKPEPRPFRWSQLESPDYGVYVANLRAIGCPEQTIREIISADLADLYAAKREESGENGPVATNLPPSATAAAQQLQKQQTEVLAQLLGPDAGRMSAPAAPKATVAAAPMPMTSAAPTRPVAADSTPAVAGSDPAARAKPAPGSARSTPEPSMPIVFTPVDPASLGLNPDQVATVKQIQQNFMQSIGGASADPSSPEYWGRWQRAQPTADEMVWTLLGQQVFNALQLTRPIRGPHSQK